MTLDDHLARYYRAAVLSLEPVGPVIADFRMAAKADPALVLAAKERLARTADIDDQRCFVTKTHREFLSVIGAL